MQIYSRKLPSGLKLLNRWNFLGGIFCSEEGMSRIHDACLPSLGNHHHRSFLERIARRFAFLKRVTQPFAFSLPLSGWSPIKGGSLDRVRRNLGYPIQPQEMKSVYACFFSLLGKHLPWLTGVFCLSERESLRFATCGMDPIYSVRLLRLPPKSTT
jgi:hypothetical protein